MILILYPKSTNMLHQKNLFFYNPGGENDNDGIGANINDESKTAGRISSETKEKPSLLKKIKDALQDWSNDDQREQQIDDKTP